MPDSNPSAGTVTSINVTSAVTLTFAWCPAGTFLMGSPDTDPDAERIEKPQHAVTLTHGFWLGQTVVTQRQWEAITRPDRKPISGELPYEPLDWFQAKSFCDLLNRMTANDPIFAHWQFDLPTEAEWEYAARAGTTSPRFCDEHELDDYCWHSGNTNDKQAVALKKPNPWNMYDMYGNVHEWCVDTFSTYAPNESANPVMINSSATAVALRGGSFQSQLAQCRSAARVEGQIYNPYDDRIGLRLVLRHTSISVYAKRP